MGHYEAGLAQFQIRIEVRREAVLELELAACGIGAWRAVVG